MQRNTLFPLIAATLCAAAMTLTVHAGEKVYKWTDAEGVVHYGQQPPTETQSEAIKVQKGYSTAAEQDPAELSEEQKKNNSRPKFAARPRRISTRWRAKRRSSRLTSTATSIRSARNRGPSRWSAPRRQWSKTASPAPIRRQPRSRFRHHTAHCPEPRSPPTTAPNSGATRLRRIVAWAAMTEQSSAL